jgi:hypothetical protein
MLFMEPLPATRNIATTRLGAHNGRMETTGEFRCVDAEVNYLGPMNVRPEFFAVKHRDNNLNLVPTRVRIEDLRGHETGTSLEIEGFQLVPYPTAVRDFRDPQQIAAVYAPEIEALIRRFTAAPKIVVSGAVLRWGEREPHPEFVNSRPGRFTHVDYSRGSFNEFARMHLSNDPDRERWLEGRYAAYNIWRVLSPPPQDIPLGLIDARTASPDDVVEGDAVIDGEGRPEMRFGSSLYRASLRHRWVYFSNMRPDEALVFKAFDSDPRRVQGCPHCAFDDPSCPPGAVPRSSCEIRAYAFWGK